MKDSLLYISSVVVFLNRPYYFRFFKDFLKIFKNLPQILIGSLKAKIGFTCLI